MPLVINPRQDKERDTNTPSITVVKSAPRLTFPKFEKKEKEESEGGYKPNHIAAPNLERASIAVDLGTPNLGTAWQINGISLFYEKLKAHGHWAAGNADQYLWFTSFLYMGGSEIYRESSEKIKFPGNIENREAEFESSINALQNVPQPLVVPGGQQLILELSSFETFGFTIALFIGGELTKGKITMNYTRVHA